MGSNKSKLSGSLGNQIYVEILGKKVYDTQKFSALQIAPLPVVNKWKVQNSKL